MIEKPKKIGKGTKKSSKKSEQKISINEEKPIDNTLLNKVLPLLENFDHRLLAIEKKNAELEQKIQKLVEKHTVAKKWTEKEIYPLIKEAYHSSSEMLKDHAPIPFIVKYIKEKIEIEQSFLEELIYSLFIQNKIDLQPGKSRTGTPLIKNNHSFYWMKILEE